MITGLFLAILASILFNAAVVLQATESRAVSSEHGLRLSLVRCLLGRPRWLAGLLLSIVGAGLQILALTQAPLTVVQPADAAGLILLVIVGSRTLGEKVGWREAAAVSGVVVGVSGIVAAEPTRSAGHTSTAALVVGLAAVGLLAAAPYLLRRRGTHGLVVVFGAGFAFAASAFALKLLAHALAAHDWPSLALVTGVVAAAGVAGTVSEQTALQLRSATQVAPIVLVIQLIVPLLLAITVGGESWGAQSLLLGGGWLLVLLASVIALATTPAASAFVAGTAEAVPGDGDGARRSSTALAIV